MTIEEAIKKAIDVGWRPTGDNNGYHINDVIAGYACHSNWEDHAFLDLLFWQSLGKAMGWTQIYHYCEETPKECCEICAEEEGRCHRAGNVRDGFHGCTHGEGQEWLFHWHRFIDHLAEGKTAETFFEELLK